MSVRSPRQVGFGRFMAGVDKQREQPGSACPAPAWVVLAQPEVPGAARERDRRIMMIWW